jgi:hypothetical protein
VDFVFVPQVVAKYFNVWDPPPNPAQRMIYLEKDILGTARVPFVVSVAVS